MSCRFRPGIWRNVSCSPLAYRLLNVVLILGVLLSPLQSLAAPARGVLALPATNPTDTPLSLPMQRMPSSSPRQAAQDSWDGVKVIDPVVIREDGLYKMWYSGQDLDNVFRIGYATSTDGIHWTKHAGNPVVDVGETGAWDSEMVRVNAVIKDGSTYRMWYIGDGHQRIGYATSTDGIHWTKYADNPVFDAGPAGRGEQRQVSTSEPLQYTAYYENLPAATAPAQEVVVVGRLDPDLDWTSFRFEEVAFGDRVIPLTDATYQFYTRQTVPDYREDVNKEWWVDITGEINPLTGRVQWTFRTLDPETGELPLEALAGFLPPNDDTGRGEGHVSFSVQPRLSLPDGTLITNKATIVFDTEASISTNEVSNTIGRCYDFLEPSGVGVEDIQVVAARWRLTAADPDPDHNPDTPNYEARFVAVGVEVITIADIMRVAAAWERTCQ